MRHYFTLLSKNLLLLLFAVICFLFFTVKSVAQVVNVEEKRLEKRKGWSGQVDFGLDITRNIQQIIEVKNSFDIQYKNGKNTVLLLNDVNIINAENENLLNKGYQHIRYKYDLKEDMLAPESFVQVQYNTVQKMKVRALGGLGPRLTFFNTDIFSLHFGPLIMYEYEEITDDVTINRTWRSSNYLSFSLKPVKIVRLTSTTYYQPSFADIQDFRVSNESLLAISVNDHFAFKFVYEFLYDTRPPKDIPTTNYTFSNAISYRF